MSDYSATFLWIALGLCCALPAAGVAVVLGLYYALAKRTPRLDVDQGDLPTGEKRTTFVLTLAPRTRRIRPARIEHEEE